MWYYLSCVKISYVLFSIIIGDQKILNNIYLCFYTPPESMFSGGIESSR